MSRQHVRLHLGPMVQIEDLGSANGTRVAGARLRPHERTPLPAGQVAEIGSSWLMVSNAPLSRSTTQQMMSTQTEMTPPPAVRPTASAAPDDGLIVQDPGHAQPASADRARRAQRHRRAAARRDRRGQGGVRAPASRTLAARERRPFCGSTAPRCRRRCSRASSSATRRARSPAPGRPSSGCSRPADGGTVFLDEVGEMPLRDPGQAAAACSRSAQVHARRRHSAASDRRAVPCGDQSRSGSRGRGRRVPRDLYFRLNGISVQIPPLRERLQEIEPLARRFVVVAAGRRGVAVPGSIPRSRRCAIAAGPGTSASCAT